MIEGDFEVSQSNFISSSRRQETEVPEVNLLENRQNLFYRVSAVTRPSLIPRTESYRPLSLRTKRAQIYKEIKSNWHTKEAREAVEEAKIRDKIAGQYLDQEEFEVDFVELGKQKARFNIIRPPEEVDKRLDPIFLIPGISNDLDAVGWLVQELAYQGREVVTVGFPESFLGTVTSEFAEAVVNTDSYEPHTTFFRNALEKLIGADKNVEIWGFSTGAPITSELLQDVDLQARVSKAVLLCPASSSDMTKGQLNRAIIQDGLYLARKLKDSSKYTLTSGRKDINGVESELPEQRKLKKGIFEKLLTKVRAKKETWKSARVQQGGEIVIVSGQKDNMTRSREEFNDGESVKLANPQARLIDLPDMYHVSPLIYPEKIIPLI